MEPILNKNYQELDKLLQSLEQNHEVGLDSWNFHLTNVQNSLLIGDIGEVRSGLNWMYNTVSDFRASVIEAGRELNTIENSK